MHEALILWILWRPCINFRIALFTMFKVVNTVLVVVNPQKINKSRKGTRYCANCICCWVKLLAASVSSWEPNWGWWGLLTGNSNLQKNDKGGQKRDCYYRDYSAVKKSFVICSPKFSTLSYNFSTFLQAKFLDVFWSIRLPSDPLGCIWTHSDAFWSVWGLTLSDFEKIWIFWIVISFSIFWT